MIKKKPTIPALVIAGTLTPFALMPASAKAMEEIMIYGVQFEELEYRFGDDTDVLAWSGDAVYGTDELKLRLQSEGEYTREHAAFETLEHQLLGQKMISGFFDLKLGLRYDNPEGPDRTYAVLGVQGLAPQWIEVDADLFLSEKGDLSARLDMDYELLVTNRLILTPAAEINVAFSEDAEIGLGSGLSTAELGLRLSYDLVDRSVAPYVGIAYERKFGNTADFARAAGEDTEEFFTMAGLRLMF